MFRNWLTQSASMDPTTNNTAPSSSSSAFSVGNMSMPLPLHLPFPQPPPASLPPNILIEVGPPPCTRFAAHSALLATHSGYLRAAIRSTEDTNMDLPIFLPNITVDQFTPLLTYMYTGFLDLNIDNIFGVLLATHVLHMPRALEICRNFLSNHSTDNYEARMQMQQQQQQQQQAKGNSENIKVVRPIASKAPGIGLNFIAPPASHILLGSSVDTPFKSLNERNMSATNANTPLTKPSTSGMSTNVASSGSASVTKKEPKIVKNINSTSTHSKSKSAASNRETISNNNQSEQNTSDLNKVIIDIASCDGPVRFSRVLNDAYGVNNTKNSNINNNNNNNQFQLQQQQAHQQSESQELIIQNRSQYVNTSFHQQMVRNINEQQRFNNNCEKSQQQLYNSDDSDDNNSQDPNQNQLLRPRNQSTSSNHSQSGEIYNCVYCKHTFKSQYCYQKHAKRHINPLSMEKVEMATTCSNNSDVDGENLNNDLTKSKAIAVNKHPAVISIGDATTSGGGSTPNATNELAAVVSGNNKREVKPLDMNVQYYPCKTCGSKFPSYYFVHKHRKLCHADEEN